MGQIEKTVFISYRRTNLPWALNIYQNLTAHGYDVFFDYESINSGDFEQVILGNIRARAHFLVILTPSMLERINEPNDWVRREIETALDEQRNIVSLFFEGFNFSDPYISGKLNGKLNLLKKYAGFDVPASYFIEAMDRLRNRYLNVSLDVVKHPISPTAQKASQKQQIAASKAEPVKEKELTAQEWFEKGYKSTDSDEQISCYTEAIRLKPDYSDAYVNRGSARLAKGDLDGAIYEYSQAIRIKPDFAEPFYGQGLAYYKKGDFDSAIRDTSTAIKINPRYAEAYYNRGHARYAKGEWNEAIRDYTEAIRVSPSYYVAYFGRGSTRYQVGDIDGAIKDYTEFIQHHPNNADAYWGRGNAWWRKEDYYSAVADYQKYFDVGGTDERVREYLNNAKKKIEKK